MPDSAAATKFSLPPSRARVVRPRLYETLSRGPAGGVILVCAPAGFGKTTLVADWIRSGGISTAWLTLDEDDNDSSRFLSNLAAALPQRHSRAASAMRHLLDEAPPLEERSIISALVNGVGASELLLVLDDYHLIGASAVHETVAYLIEHLPVSLRVLVCTRADPPLPLSRRRADGTLTEIRAAQLRFTVAEAASLFAGLRTPRLDEAAVATLTERTDGWAVGLRLAAASLRDARDIPSFLRDFSGSNRFILDYLSEEVLGNQSPATRDFLVRTSILVRLSGPLCDALTGRADGQETLEALEAGNVFIEALDEHRGWFRYHPLFADILRARFDRLPAEETVSLHRRASEWYESAGIAGEAITHALLAHDYPRAAEAALANAENALVHCEAAPFLRWTDALPEEERRARPLLGVFRACAHVLLGSATDRVLACLEETRAAGGARAFGPEIAALKAYLAYLERKPRESVSFVRKALIGLPTERKFLSIFMRGILGALSHAAGDTRTAASVYEVTLREARDANKQFSSVVLQWRLADLSFMQGKLREAEAMCVCAVTLAADESGKPLPVVCLPLLLQAKIHLQRNELEKAACSLREAREPARAWTPGSYREYLVISSRLASARGEPTAALAVAREAQGLATGGSGRDPERAAVAADLTVAILAAGDAEGARSWANECGLGREIARARQGSRDSRPFLVLQTAQANAYARLLLREGAPREAAEVAEALLPLTRARGLREGEIALLVASAQAHEACGNRRRADALLGRALGLTAEEGLLGVYREAGPEILPLLKRVEPRVSARGHVQAVLALFDAHPSSSTRVEAAAVLSAREMTVLRAIATGLSNKEIAGRMFVTEQTVKWHAGNIYGKLGVKSRTQAVARARALGIITEKEQVAAL